jgi:chitodextrinase
VAVVLGLASVSALLIPGLARAAACQQSGPADNPYTVNVCFTSPSDGSTASGPTTVSVTVSVTGTSPGIRRMTSYLDGAHLLTDFQAPYTFTIPSDRFVDGTKTIEVEAWMRDGFISQRASISLQFANGVTSPPVNTNTFTPTSGRPAGPGEAFVVAAAGDGAGGEQSETGTVNEIASWNPNLFLYLGDVYEKATVTEFYNWYRPTDSFYGRFRPITDPTIGNHEYENGQAPGYFDYWDNVPRYYSFDANGWHLVSLDSNASVTPTVQGSPQYNWLLNDLTANTNPCVVAYFHHPLFNIGEEGSELSMVEMWSLFTQKGVDLVLVAHDHTYQRWQPLDASGAPSASGVTQIVVGTGGHALGSFIQSDPRVVATATEYGALRLVLNSEGAGYQFVTAQGQTLDSGSVGCNGAAPDTTPPSSPSALTAAGAYKTRVDLSWAASSDNVGVTGYRIYRDGQVLDTVGAETTYADPTVQPGSTHTYEVRALDAANNVSEFSNSATATTPTVAVLFSDGFESGTLAGWTQNNGLVVQQSHVFAGSYAAQGVSSGSAGASAYRQLAESEASLYYIARFKVLSQSQNVNVLRFRNSTVAASALTTLFVTNASKLGLRNDVTGAATTSSTTAAAGQWHTVQVHLVVNGLASQTEVWLDGTLVADLSQSGVNVGTNPIGRLEIGDPSLGRTFDIAFDEVAYDREFVGDPTPPTPATNLTASAPSGLQVDLAWTAGTDNVGISGYDVYRSGSRIVTIGPVTSYADKTVSPLTAYSYRLIARDAAGNPSDPSNTASVTTGNAFGDNFETGDLSKWTTVNGLTVQQAVVDAGNWAARAVSDGTAGASAEAQLSTTVGELYYRTRFRIASQGANSISLLRFRSGASAALASAFVSSTGKLGYRNDTNAGVTTSGQTVAPLIWHELQMRLLANGASSLVELWLNGLKVMSQSTTLPAGAIGRLELGDPSAGRSFDVAFDSVVSDATFVGDVTPPSAPTNLHIVNSSPSQVALAWTGSDDNVDVSAYRVWRNGEVLATTGATTTYTDAAVSPLTHYDYSVQALDGAGNASGMSNTASVDTPGPTLACWPFAGPVPLPVERCK